MEKILEINRVTKTFCADNVCVANDLDFWIKPGETFTVLGESGCGKSTLLRMIAGFEAPDSGSIHIHGKTVCSETLFVGPEDRNLGIIFQNYALFPHMTVGQNIAFGLDHLDSDQRKTRIGEVLGLSGLQNLQKRYPHELSGGQQQRVAFARAIAPEPELLLMDEPFSNLDVGLKENLRRELKGIIKESGMTVVLVTHDQQDAFELSDRIAIMKDGQIEQIGTPKALYFHPHTRYVADFFGKANVMECVYEEGLIKAPFGVMEHEGPLEKELKIVIRPEAIRVGERGVFSGIVKENTFQGAHQAVMIETQGAELYALLHHHVDVSLHQEIRFSLSAYGVL